MQNIWLKLKNLRPFLRKLNTKEFKFIKQKIVKVKTGLATTKGKIYLQYSDELLMEEKYLI